MSGGGGGAVQNQTPDYNTATYYSFKYRTVQTPHTYNQHSMVYIRLPLVYLKQNQNINNIIRFYLLNL